MRRGSGVPVPLLFVGSGIVQYVGAAFAVGLFAFMAPLGVVWWRVAFGAAVLTLLWRPWRFRWSGLALAFAALFGVALAVMNGLFYEAIARLPLGTAVAIEFLGPVGVAVIRGKGMLPRIAALLALGGIVLIGGWGLDLLAPDAMTGFLFALGAAGAWAAYILLGSFISGRGLPAYRRTPPTSVRPTASGPSLALGVLFAGIISLPFMYGTAFQVEFSWNLVLMLAAVGVFSTAIPYSIEAVAFGRISASMFALLTALLPATSTVVGAIMLQQVPNLFEILGLVLVSVAVWMATKAPDVEPATPDLEE